MGLFEIFRMEDSFGAVSGAVTVLIYNAANRKPFISRLPLVAVGAAVGYGVGYYVRQTKEQGILDRELIIRDYVQRHPEDFKEFEPKKYKDVLHAWHPIR